jgi:dUTP pyrophosphatase
MKISFKKLDDKAFVPRHMTEGAAGMDLTATSMDFTEKFVEYGTGLAVAIPEGYVGLLFPRSSISKMEMSMANSVGVIDSDYRGEIKVRLRYKQPIPSFLYAVGERVAQLVIVPYTQVEAQLVDILPDTARGEGGFGSTNT